MAKKYDIVAIGDITTDAFIRLKDATVHCDINKENCTLSVRFGDKIPYEFMEEVRAVGNSPNGAVCATRLGLKTALYANLGDDDNGKRCLSELEKNCVATEFVKVHTGKKTNYHYVLWYEDERTILIKHEEYPYILPDMGDEGWLYLSSLGESSLPFHHELAIYVKAHSNLNLAFQPGTFQMKLGKDELKDIYECTKVFFCNREEAKKILKTDDDDIKKLLAGIQTLGPKITVITDGPKGAYALENEKFLFMPPYPDPKPPYERTGA